VHTPCLQAMVRMQTHWSLRHSLNSVKTPLQAHATLSVRPLAHSTYAARVSWQVSRASASICFRTVSRSRYLRLCSPGALRRSSRAVDLTSFGGDCSVIVGRSGGSAREDGAQAARERGSLVRSRHGSILASYSIVQGGGGIILEILGGTSNYGPAEGTALSSCVDVYVASLRGALCDTHTPGSWDAGTALGGAFAGPLRPRPTAPPSHCGRTSVTRHRAGPTARLVRTKLAIYEINSIHLAKRENLI